MKSWLLRFEEGAGPAWMAGRAATVFAERGPEPAGKRLASCENKTSVAEDAGTLRL